MRTVFSINCMLLLALMLGADAETNTVPETEVVTSPAGGTEVQVGTDPQLVTDGQAVGGVQPEGAPLRLSAQETLRYRDLDGRTIQTFSNADLGDYLPLREKAIAADGLRFIAHEEIGRMGRRALGQTFRLNAVQFDLAEGDCVSFVNRTLALALAKDWESYYLLIERIRHKDGVVDYRNRNFFTLGDWLPNNAWLLEDVTAQLGPADNRPAKSFTHMVRPKVFEERPGVPGTGAVRIIFKGSDYKSPNKETRQDSYIPRDLVASILRELQTGDVVLVLRDSAGGHLGCDHMGIIARHEDGRVMMIHSAPPQVREQELMSFLRDYKHVRGFKFLRPREDVKERAAVETDKLRGQVPRPTAQEVDQRNAVLRSNRADALGYRGSSSVTQALRRVEQDHKRIASTLARIERKLAND